MKTKLCRHCGKDVPVEEFFPHPRSRDRLQYWCRPCFNAYRQEPGYKLKLKLKKLAMGKK